MFTVRPLNGNLQKIAQVELGEITDRIPEDLQALKLWIQQQPHLKARLDDQFLIQFLRGCKYSLERAKEKIDLFFTLKTKYPENFSNTNVDHQRFRRNFNLGIFVPLSIPLNESGPRILVFRFNYSTSQVHTEEIFRCVNAVPEVLIMDDPFACIQGIVFVMDMAQASASHLMQFTPSFLKKMVTYYEKTLPLRIKGIYCINASPIAEQFFKLILSLLSEKLRQRFFICGRNFDTLADNFPQKYLPQDYGGENGSLAHLCEEYNKVWDKHREYFKQNAEFGTEERFRLGKPIDFDGTFGLGGSFRKLDVD